MFGRESVPFMDLTSTRVRSSWILQGSITFSITSAVPISIPSLFPPVRVGLLLISEKTIITHIKQLLYIYVWGEKKQDLKTKQQEPQTKLHCRQNLKDEPDARKRVG